MAFMHQRSLASVRRAASGQSRDSMENVSVGALAMPADADHRLVKRRGTTIEKESAMTSIVALDPRSASSRFAGTKTLAKSENSANVIAVAKLLARVEELLLSPSESRETILSVGPLQLDILTRQVNRGERRIDLRPREFRLLEYMMPRQGQVLTRAMLFMDVLNYKFDPHTNLVDVHVGRLRQKIDAQYEPPMIFNIRGQGFMLRAPD